MAITYFIASTVTVKKSNAYSKLNVQAEELGASWYKHKCLAVGDLFEVNPIDTTLHYPSNPLNDIKVWRQW